MRSSFRIGPGDSMHPALTVDMLKKEEMANGLQDGKVTSGNSLLIATPDRLKVPYLQPWMLAVKTHRPLTSH